MAWCSFLLLETHLITYSIFDLISFICDLYVCIESTFEEWAVFSYLPRERNTSSCSRAANKLLNTHTPTHTSVSIDHVSINRWRRSSIAQEVYPPFEAESAFITEAFRASALYQTWDRYCNAQDIRFHSSQYPTMTTTTLSCCSLKRQLNQMCLFWI